MIRVPCVYLHNWRIIYCRIKNLQNKKNVEISLQPDIRVPALSVYTIGLEKNGRAVIPSSYDVSPAMPTETSLKRDDSASNFLYKVLFQLHMRIIELS